MNDNYLFSRKQLLGLLWPLFIEQLLAVFVGMIDVLMVAYIGELAMSGVSLVDSINNLMIQVLFAMTAGGTVVCAQYCGAKKAKEASTTIAQLHSITVLGMTAFMALFLIAGNGILSLIFHGAEQGVLDNAFLYMKLTALSFPFLAIYNSCAAAFRAIGNTKISMLVSLLMNIINIAGNALCIFILKMGVEGVAIPTIIARGIAAFLLFYLLQKNESLKIRQREWFMPKMDYLRKILSIGIPNSVESGVFQFGKLTLQSLVATLGTPSIAGFAVASNLVTYLYLPGNALGAGMLTVVGQCYGANEKDQAKYYVKRLVLYNYMVLAVISSALIFGADFWINLYNLSPQAHQLARGLLISHSIWMIVWPIGFLLPYYFRAIGKAALTMKVAIFCMWVFRIGFAYLFVKVFHMNVLSIWYAMFIDWIVRVFIYIYQFRKA